MHINEITGQIVGAAITVHRELGPGLLESAYHACLAHELHLRRISFQSQLELPVVYRGVTLDIGYRVDLMVENLVIVEIKAVESLANVHRAQLLSYLRIAKRSVGLLINFNVACVKDGIVRMVNDYRG